MLQTSSMRWRIRSATGLTWALAAAASVYWGLRLSGPVGAAPAAAPPPAPVAAADAASLARLLGVQPGPAAAPVQASGLASRMQLLGVIADRNRGGTALIAVDGKPARPYRAGAAIEPGVVVQSIGHRSASLGAAGGPAAATLEMPPLPTLATSSPAGAATGMPGLPPAAALPQGLAMQPPAAYAPPSVAAPLAGQPPAAQPLDGGLSGQVQPITN
ncbi:MAG: hypothetical protein PGN26_12860 [Xylophilus ampelinus]